MWAFSRESVVGKVQGRVLENRPNIVSQKVKEKMTPSRPQWHRQMNCCGVAELLSNERLLLVQRWGLRWRNDKRRSNVYALITLCEKRQNRGNLCALLVRRFKCDTLMICVSVSVSEDWWLKIHKLWARSHCGHKRRDSRISLNPFFNICLCSSFILKTMTDRKCVRV